MYDNSFKNYFFNNYFFNNYYKSPEYAKIVRDIHKKILEILSQEQTIEDYEAREKQITEICRPAEEQIAEICRPAEEQIAEICRSAEEQIAKINKDLEILKDSKTTQNQQYYKLSNECCKFRKWTKMDYKKQVLDRKKQVFEQIINRKAEKQIAKICGPVEEKIMIISRNIKVKILEIYNDIQYQKRFKLLVESLKGGKCKFRKREITDQEKQIPEQTSKKIESVSLTKPKNQSQFMRSATTILKSNKLVEQPKIEQLIRAEQTFKSIEQLEAGQIETDIGF